jgi:hypothetical protein
MIDETSSWYTVHVNLNDLCCYVRSPENSRFSDELRIPPVGLPHFPALCRPSLRPHGMALDTTETGRRAQKTLAGAKRGGEALV